MIRYFAGLKIFFKGDQRQTFPIVKKVVMIEFAILQFTLLSFVPGAVLGVMILSEAMITRSGSSDNRISLRSCQQFNIFAFPERLDLLATDPSFDFSVLSQIELFLKNRNAVRTDRRRLWCRQILLCL